MFIGVGIPRVDAEEVFPSAAEEVAAINVGWNLGNTLDSYGTWISGTTPSAYETAWGNPVTTQAMIQSVHDKGINAIRIPVTWAQHIDANGGIDPAWMARVREVVDYAYNLGMYVILNVHHDTGEHGGDKVCWVIADEGTYNSAQDKFRNLWTNIANEFNSYGPRLMFEGYNEMLDMNNTWNAPSTGDGAYNAVNNYAQVFVDAVRATGGNNSQRNLIINTYVASIDPSVLNHFRLPTDSAQNHLIAEVHIYAPWGFTGTAATVNWTPVHSDFNDADRNELDGVMSAIQNFSNSQGVPVIIGECGAEYKSNDDAIAQYAGYLINSASSKGIKCFWWDNGIYGTGSSESGYAIFDRNSLTWKDSIVSALISNSSAQPLPETTEPEQTEPTEETEATGVTETTAEETTAATTIEQTTTTTTEATAEAAETTVVQTEDASEDSGSGIVLWIAIGAVVVLGSYVGLFALGRHNRNKKGNNC